MHMHMTLAQCVVFSSGYLNTVANTSVPEPCRLRQHAVFTLALLYGYASVLHHCHSSWWFCVEEECLSALKYDILLSHESLRPMDVHSRARPIISVTSICLFVDGVVGPYLQLVDRWFVGRMCFSDKLTVRTGFRGIAFWYMHFTCLVFFAVCPGPMLAAVCPDSFRMGIYGCCIRFNDASTETVAWFHWNTMRVRVRDFTRRKRISGIMVSRMFESDDNNHQLPCSSGFTHGGCPPLRLGIVPITQFTTESLLFSSLPPWRLLTQVTLRISVPDTKASSNLLLSSKTRAIIYPHCTKFNLFPFQIPWMSATIIENGNEHVITYYIS